MSQFFIGLLIGVVVYIGAYFLITSIKKRKQKKTPNADNNKTSTKGD